MTPTLNIAATPSIVREDDLLQHIEDSREFWITRNGRPVKRAWGELTATERRLTIEAENRTAYNAIFNPNGF
jgi:hypothetical protein